jgi:hypothetical protein
MTFGIHAHKTICKVRLPIEDAFLKKLDMQLTTSMNILLLSARFESSDKRLIFIPATEFAEETLHITRMLSSPQLFVDPREAMPSMEP